MMETVMKPVHNDHNENRLVTTSQYQAIAA